MRSDSGTLIGFQAKGHAGFANYGEDTVCAAASAILQTAALALTELCSAKPELVIKPGFLTCDCPHYELETDRLKAQTIMETALLGCHNLAYQFPSHIQIS